MKKQTVIKSWLESEGRSSKWLAETLGISEQHMSKISTGKAQVTRTTALAIERVTNGAVPADSWNGE